MGEKQSDWSPERIETERQRQERLSPVQRLQPFSDPAQQSNQHNPLDPAPILELVVRAIQPLSQDDRARVLRGAKAFFNIP